MEDLEGQKDDVRMGTGTGTGTEDAGALLGPWPGPYGGVPPFDRVRVELFGPALERAMEGYREDIRAVAGTVAPADFANTMEALERAGRAYDRVRVLFGVWSATANDAAFREVETIWQPRFAALRDEVMQNAGLFRRVEAVEGLGQRDTWTPEQRRLVWLHHTEFVRAGARLGSAGKERVAAVNRRLAELFTRFRQNLLGDEEELGTWVDRESDLDGLPETLRRAAASQAEARGGRGRWLIANSRSSVEPLLTLATRRDLRERVWRAFVARGDHAGPRDNKPVIAEIVRLRAERASLLGYASHAHWRLEHSMAGSPDRAMALMETLWGPAVARVREEVAAMQALADAEGGGVRIAPWDYRYYAEKVRRERFALDEAELKPYLRLESLREAMFWVAGRLFDWEFLPAADVPVMHPDARVWEVRRRGGGLVGVFYFDPFLRAGKRSGAWMSLYRAGERLEGEVTPLVGNHSNFVPGGPGEGVTISWEDARTLFHEFGHAVHGLASEVVYPSLSGTRVARDYVELPSQLLERWLMSPELLERFARHERTGESMPAALIGRVRKAATFNQGFATVEFLASALLDMKLHVAGSGRDLDPAAFEREALLELGMPAEIVMRHRLPQFAHLFGDDGYSAAYYSYLWADMLTADAAEAFEEGEGLFDRAVAERLRVHVLSAGNTVDPAEGYRRFRGRDAQLGALMRDRGFAGNGG
ncbi:MAG: M3 family metallopeptidase [Verrucomicrobiae bacterium]|nr:M3 family metallopeptidase [Verrucomicrobiae bacterium]